MEKIELKNILGKDITVEIVDNEQDANFITHSGTFHADEVMATVFLLNKFGDIKLFRTSNPNNKDAFIYDVGFGEFDHHQSDFDKVRKNGIKYASCGLVWDKYGKDIVSILAFDNVDEIFETVERNIVMDIDRDDNGQSLLNEPEIKQQTLPNLIGAFNPSWNEENNESKYFLKALSFANTIFNNLIKNIKAKEEAKDEIEKKIEKSSNGILILDKYMPWKDIVLSSKNKKAKDILYAVFPSERSGYNVVATPVKKDSFDLRKPFPSIWSGKENEELQEISGVETITFCHKNLFICACKTYEDALKIANIAVSNNED